MEGGLKIKQQNLRNEINAKSQNHIQKVSPLSDEWKEFAAKTKEPFFGQYILCLSKPRKFVPGYGLLQSRWSALSFGKQKKV